MIYCAKLLSSKYVYSAGLSIHFFCGHLNLRIEPEDFGWKGKRQDVYE